MNSLKIAALIALVIATVTGAVAVVKFTGPQGLAQELSWTIPEATWMDIVVNDERNSLVYAEVSTAAFVTALYLFGLTEPGRKS